MLHRCQFHKQVLVSGEPSPFFQGAKPESLQCGLWVFSPSPNSDMHKGRSGKLLQIIHVYDVGASLMSRTYFWQDPPLFLAAKNKNFTMAPMGTFCFVVLILRNPPMEIREIIGDICCTGSSQ